jgi:hypothetical protein
MLPSVAVDGRKATGRIAVLGHGGVRTYTQGEEILDLVPDPHGDWVGTLHWRGASGADHVDAIRFAAMANVLDATMTTDLCYKHMPRVP